MAIKPKEALELSAKDREAIRETEGKIDSYVEKYYSGGSISYDFSLSETGMRAVSLESLRKNYEDAGWDEVKITKTTRGGVDFDDYKILLRMGEKRINGKYDDSPLREIGLDGKIISVLNYYNVLDPQTLSTKTQDEVSNYKGIGGYRLGKIIEGLEGIGLNLKD